MNESKREPAKEENFVWIPTGHYRSEESGIVGYWDGTMELDRNGMPRAEIELMGDDGFQYVLVNLRGIYLATEADINRELESDEVQRWREYLVEREKATA